MVKHLQLRNQMLDFWSNSDMPQFRICTALVFTWEIIIFSQESQKP
jgi:hypothetical protein